MKKLSLFLAALLTATVMNLSAATVEKAPDMHDFLYLTSLKPTGTVQLNKKSLKDYYTYITATFEYSKDRINWSDYTWGAWSSKYEATGATINLNANDTVFFRAKGTNGKNATVGYHHTTYFQFVFGANDSIAAGGNVMSLYDASCEQDTMTAYGFYSLFRNAKQLVSAPKLPATQMASNCYTNMFQSCSLTQAPELPATKLAERCYSTLFSRNYTLTQAPELKSTTLAYACYANMFMNCTGLTKAPELPADTLAGYCYYQMFKGCSSLIEAPDLGHIKKILVEDVTRDTCHLVMMFMNCSKLAVDTCADGQCDGALLVTPAEGAPKWNRAMFLGCKGDPTLTTVWGIQLNSRYCIKGDVCQIGTTTYASINDAVAAVKAGETIQMLRDCKLEEMIVVSSTTPAFTLDLNGHILDGSNLTGDNKSLIYSEGTLSIIDSDPTATHEAPFDTIQGAIMTGGKGYKSGTKTYGGAIYCDNGTLNVNGVAFVSNTAYMFGGVAYLQNSAANFVNCRFYGNNSTTVGGAALYINGNQCSVDSCTIKGNSAKNGIIRITNQASLTITHTTITDNTATKYPGAIGVWNSSLTLGDGTVISNNTSNDNFPSGGIYVWNQSDYNNSITLSGKVIIKDNTSNGQPANLCLSGDPLCDEITLNGLSAGSEVYISTLDKNDAPAPRTFATNATEADLQYFKSDNGYVFILKEGKIASKQAYGRKLKTAGNYGTICLAKKFIATEGVAGLYVPASKDATYLYCEEVDVNDVEAGKAYIFKAESSKDTVTFFLDGEAVPAPVVEEGDYMIGWLKADSVLTEEIDYYFLNGNTIAKPAVGSKIKQNCAMIDLDNVPDATSAPSRRYVAFGINGKNMPTGMEDVNANVNENRKMMVNGQLIIIRDGRKFNAQGQEL